jgi:hypothetical protein
MSIEISNLTANNLVELNTTDSEAVVGGTGSRGSASTSSYTNIGGKAVTVQNANANGGRTNFANSSSGGSIEHGRVSVDGGAAALSTDSPANVNINVDFKGAFNRT